MNRAALVQQIQHARETLEKLLTLLQSAPGRARPICFSPLSVQESVPADLPNCREVRQANYLNTSDRRVHGLQGRVSEMTASAAGRRLIAVSPRDPNLVAQH
jgi:hypothetical protein